MIFHFVSFLFLFHLLIVNLISSSSFAQLFGGWLEKAGPRKGALLAALLWCGGMCLSALGIYSHQLWLMWLGSGVIGGFGLGVGYISPVSTLLKW